MKEQTAENQHAQRTVEATVPQASLAVAWDEAKVAVEWSIGDIILDLYEVKEIHEGGGMGLVYRVHHRGWNTDLAVKSPRPEFFQTEAQKESFIRECETWVNLGLHPHIVSCHYVRTLGGVPRLFAEYVEGGSLKDWIDSKKLYEGGAQEATRRILDIGIQMAWGLHYAHEQGLIHQDVKPANVLMLPDGTAKIADFGLARARTAAGEMPEAAAGASILVSTGGMTPAYCSPEQAHKQPLTRKTDLWSWAVSVLEMFTGEVVWASGTAAPQLLEELNELRAQDVELPFMPEALRQLLRHCFAGEIQSRPGDFLEISRALLDIYRLSGQEGYPRPEASPAPLLADGLNNRAISLLDLRRSEEAERILADALRVEPSHREATLNLGLLKWRCGGMTDSALLTQLKQIRSQSTQTWRCLWLEALVHIERGDRAAAALLLDEALRLSGGERNVAEALNLTRIGNEPRGRCTTEFAAGIGEIETVCFTPDGGGVLVGGGDTGKRDYALGLFRLDNGQPALRLVGHTASVTAVQVLPDGRHALSAGYDHTLRLWDLTSGRCVRVMEGHSETVTAVAISADGRLAVSGSRDTTLRVWELETGRCSRVLEGHLDVVNSVALAPGKRFALSGGGVYTGGHRERGWEVRLWDIESGECLQTLPGHGLLVSSVDISADGKDGLSGSWDRTLRLWDLATGKCARILIGSEGLIYSVAMNSARQVAVASGSDGKIRLWDLITGKCARTFDEAPKGGKSVALSPAGDRAVSGGADGIVRIWQLDTGRLVPFQLVQPKQVRELLDNTRLFQVKLQAGREALQRGTPTATLERAEAALRVPGYSQNAEALDILRQAGLFAKRKALLAGWCERTFKIQKKERQYAAMSADGRWGLLTQTHDSFQLVDFATGDQVRGFQARKGWINAVWLSADGTVGLAADSAGISCWSLPSGDCTHMLNIETTYNDSIRSVALSPDRALVIAGHGDGTLSVWQLPSGRFVKRLRGHAREVTGSERSIIPKHGVQTVRFSPDGQSVFSGSWDQTIRAWDVRTGSCLLTLEGSEEEITSLALSADGSRALSGSGVRFGQAKANPLRLWDLHSGKCLRALAGHPEKVASVWLSPDGLWGLSGGGGLQTHDASLRVWNLESGDCVQVLDGHTGEIESLVVSDDLRWALTMSHDGTARLWQLRWQYEARDSQEWEDGAKRYLESFLSCRTPYVSIDPDDPEFLVRRGRPTWSHQDWLDLLRTLQCAGYGWLRPEGVGRQLETMAAEWQDTPSSPWERAR